MAKLQERRKYARLRREERAVLRKLNDDDPADAALYCATIDISPSGLQVRLSKELLPGEPVDVVLQMEGYVNPFHLTGETKWCVPLRGENTYLAGVEIKVTKDRDFVFWRRLFN
ncbi:MAG: PilZ domain-containing protein [Gammaproteobacteria bacterium]